MFEKLMQRRGGWKMSLIFVKMFDEKEKEVYMDELTMTGLQMVINECEDLKRLAQQKSEEIEEEDI